MIASGLTGMSGNYLLDTSVLIELFAQDKDILARLAKAKSTFIPSIALGELHYGARKSSRTEKNLEQLEQLATKVVILPRCARNWNLTPRVSGWTCCLQT